MASVRTKTPPALEPLTLAEAKTWVRMETGITAADAELTRLIRACREAGEIFTGRAWQTQVLLETFDAWPVGRELRLQRPPLISVASVSYYDLAGVLQVLDPAKYYVVADEDEPRVVLKTIESWPDLEDGRPDPIVVEFSAGFGAPATAVPGPYVAGFQLLLCHLVQNHSEVEVGTNVVELPYGLEDLWAFRRIIPV